MIGIADSLGPSTPALDLSDLYRHSLAASVSALDTFIHSIVRVGLLLQLRGVGPEPNVQLPVSADLFRRWFGGEHAALIEIELEVRRAHGQWTMQSPKNIADAVKLVSRRPLWISLAGQDSQRAAELKTELDLVVGRRNRIVHESDLDPSTGCKWPMDSTLALGAINVICRTGESVAEHVAAEY